MLTSSYTSESEVASERSIACVSGDGDRRGLARRVARAFTLVELLVVIGIFAILIAISLPSLANARYRAKEVSCSSNLRQIAMVLTGYAAENKGWYPKNGACRNKPNSLKNVDGGRTLWDMYTPMLRYLHAEKGHDVFRCPLTQPSMVNTATTSSYLIMVDTWGYGSSPHGAIADHPTNRPLQYDVNGVVVVTATTGNSAWRTYYWPYLDEKHLLRHQGDYWMATVGSQQMGFRVLAMDHYQGRGHPVRSRESNHPDRAEGWKPTGTFWTGMSGRNPKTSANYLLTDGSVYRHRVTGGNYFTSPPDGTYSISGVGRIPVELRVR